MLAVLLVLASVQLCLAEEEVRVVVSPPQYYCGKRLTSALSLICSSTFASKRGDPDVPTEYTDYEEPLSVEFDRAEGPSIYRRKSEALSMTNGRLFRERRQGVVNECCRQPCTIAELSTYCGGSDGS